MNFLTYLKSFPAQVERMSVNIPHTIFVYLFVYLFDRSLLPRHWC